MAGLKAMEELEEDRRKERLPGPARPGIAATAVAVVYYKVMDGKRRA